MDLTIDDFEIGTKVITPLARRGVVTRIRSGETYQRSGTKPNDIFDRITVKYDKSTHYRGGTVELQPHLLKII